MSHKTIEVPLNRVEGDLRIRAEIDDGVVSDAWCSGTMYRGFERILVGRGALDGIVITPRICGICSTSHLAAAARALDAIAGVSLPADAIRIRNVAVMTEHVQSDMRHSFLMFAADLANPRYSNSQGSDEAVRRYQPLKGETALEVIRETKRLLEIVAILGGQWPHSSFMVPGGVASRPSASELLQCRHLLSQYRDWYERRILGCCIDRWLEVRSLSDLDQWLEESDSHRDSDLGFLVRVSRELGFDEIGRGHGTFLSYGCLDLPEDTQVPSPAGDGCLVPAGFVQDSQVRDFDQGSISEHVAHSWFRSYEGGRHPLKGETVPYATGSEGKEYSWAKAPRYDGHPAEVGPLADMVVGKEPLFGELTTTTGPSVLARILARVVRATKMLPAMGTWLAEATGDGTFYTSPGEIVDGEAAGLTHATRGALGHWVRVSDGQIEHYQIITPTAWNASPRDSDGMRGPIEEALVGTPVEDPEDPVELGHVVRSFDPCLVCTVHAVRCGRRVGRLPLAATS